MIGAVCSKGFLHLWLILSILLSVIVAPLFQPAPVLATEPYAPTNLSPTGSIATLTPTLQASDFSDPDDGDTQDPFRVGGIKEPVVRRCSGVFAHGSPVQCGGAHRFPGVLHHLLLAGKILRQRYRVFGLGRRVLHNPADPDRFTFGEHRQRHRRYRHLGHPQRQPYRHGHGRQRQRVLRVGSNHVLRQ